MVDAANRHSVGLAADGTVEVWGGSSSRFNPVPDDLTDAIGVSAGYYNCLILRENGSVLDLGQFRDEIPDELDDVVAVSAGTRHSLALRSDGRVVAWGDPRNQFEALDVPDTLNNAVAISAGQQFSVAVTDDGRVVGWGNRESYRFDEAESILTRIVAIDLGPFGHGLAIRDDGTVVAFGNNEFGQATPPEGLTDVVAVAAGSTHSLALTRSGEVVGWGNNAHGGAHPPDAVIQALGIAAGETHSIVLTRAPVVYETPESLYVLAGDDVQLAPSVAASAPFEISWSKDGELLPESQTIPLLLRDAQSNRGGVYSLVVQNDFGWHESRPMSVGVDPSPPRWERMPVHQAGPEGTTIQLDAAIKGSRPFEYQWYKEGLPIEGATEPVHIIDAATDADAGTYRLEVRNEYGELRSDPVQIAVSLPVIVDPSAPFRQVRRGWSEEIELQVISSTEVSYQWSKNGVPLEGETGPNLVLENIAESDSGLYDALIENQFGSIRSEPVEVILLDDFPQWPDPGVVVAWGKNWENQTNPPEGLTDVVGVAAGEAHNLALISDGSLVSWGSPNLVKLHQIPAGATDIVEVAAAKDRSAALRRDGAIFQWTQYGPSEPLTDVVAATIAVSEYFLVAATRDGRVVQHPSPDKIPEGLANIVDVAAGEYHYALRSDGVLVRWNPTRNEVRAEFLPDMKGLTAFDADRWSYGGLKRSGVIVGSELGPPELENPLAIEVARDGSLAIDGNGRVHAWGTVSNALQPPPGLVATRISATTAHAVALTSFPFLKTHPRSDIRYTGATLRFEVNARSVSPPGYQWFVDGLPIDNATAETLQIPNLSPKHAGEYHVRLTNAAGSVNSQPARIQVLGPPELTDQPGDLTIGAGEPFSLIVRVVSDPPATLQWFFEGRPILGATEERLALANPQREASGRYTLLAANSFGSVSSGDIDVTIVEQGPNIVDLPDASVGDGGPAELRATVTGSIPMEFQWSFEGNPIPGATGPVLRIENVQSGNAGEYVLNITNPHGAASASAAIRTESQAPVGQLRPSWQMAWEADIVTLTCEWEGTQPLEFQWFEGDRALDRETGVSLTLSVEQGLRMYRVMARNALGTAFSNTAAILGRPRPLPGLLKAWGSIAPLELNGPELVVDAALGAAHWIALRPDKTVVAGGRNDLGQSDPPPGLVDIVEVDAGGDLSLALRADGTVFGWGQNRQGQASPPAGLTGVIAISAGREHAAALRLDGSVICWGASDLIQPPPEATDLVAIDAAADHTLALRADGRVVGWGRRFAPLTIPDAAQFGVAIAASSELNVVLTPAGKVVAWGNRVPRPDELPTPVSIQAGGGSVIESYSDLSITMWGSGRPTIPAALNLVSTAEFNGSGGLAISARPEVRQIGNPQITVGVNEPLALAVAAAGTPPIAYRWLRNGEPIEGQFGETFLLESFVPGDAGDYVAEVMNGFATESSPPFRVEAGIPPEISTSPASRTVTPPGESVSLRAQVTGTPPLEIYWSFNGAKLRGETNPVLTLDPISHQDQGIFRIHIRNRFGEATSPPAELIVSREANPESREGPKPAIALTPANRSPGDPLDYHVQLQFPVEQGRIYHVESSIDLRLWKIEQTIASDTNVLRFTVDPEDSPRKFYRVKQREEPRE